MISERITVIERIKNEFQFISNNPILNIGINIELPRDDNIFEWRGFLIGPDDTPYKGGFFYFKMLIPQEYPQKSPEIIFLTPIYHVNINHINQPGCPLGHISLSFLNFWNGKYIIKQILIKLYTAVFYLANPDSPFGPERRHEIINNPELFEKKIKYFTKKYAYINNVSNIYKVWDFTYNIKDDKNNEYINITFELDGINRFSCQVKKNEITDNVVKNYCQSFGMQRKHYCFFYKSKRLILNKTLEENEIDNNSLIIVIYTNDTICG
jgi:ubiquitin-protein ligase